MSRIFWLGHQKPQAMQDIQIDLSCPVCNWEWHRSSLPSEAGTPTNLGLEAIDAMTRHHHEEHQGSMVLTLWTGLRFLGRRTTKEDT